MVDYNAKWDRSTKVYADKFVDAAKLPASYSLHQGKKLIKKTTAVLSETYNQSK